MNSAAVRFNGQEPSPEATSNPQTYLVTGGTGFLGCALVARLPADGRTTRIARSLPRSSGGFVACDLNAMVQAWRAAAEGCSGVFHLAWATVPKTANADPLADLEANVTGTVRLLEALRGLPNIPITFASSGGTVYGDADTLPVPEDHPLRPRTAYGVSKVAVEQYALLYRRLWAVDARIVRLSNPFGPGQDIKGNSARLRSSRAVCLPDSASRSGATGSDGLRPFFGMCCHLQVWRLDMRYNFAFISSPQNPSQFLTAFPFCRALLTPFMRIRTIEQGGNTSATFHRK